MKAEELIMLACAAEKSERPFSEVALLAAALMEDGCGFRHEEAEVLVGGCIEAKMAVTRMKDRGELDERDRRLFGTRHGKKEALKFFESPMWKGLDS